MEPFWQMKTISKAITLLPLAAISLLLTDLPYFSLAHNTISPELDASPAQPQTPSDPKTRKGTVSLKSYRPFKPAGSPRLADLLKGYAVKPATFDWQMKLIRQNQY